jgi:hypothetical protein
VLLLSLFPTGVAAAAGDSLSVKAVRQAVQAATGWPLDAANLRAVVKATCAEYLQQQQQQQGGDEQQQQQGVSDAAVTKVVRKLLKKGELTRDEQLLVHLCICSNSGAVLLI